MKYRKSLTDIAKRHGVTRNYVYQIIGGRRTTKRIPLALELAEVTGKNPLEFLNFRTRKYWKEYLDVFSESRTHERTQNNKTEVRR